MIWRPPEDTMRNALKVLKPALHDRAAAQKQLEGFIGIIHYRAGISDTSKPQRIAVLRLLATLRRTQSAAKAAAKLDDHWVYFPVKLEDHIAQCEETLPSPIGRNTVSLISKDRR
jgi:hypothetical protein